MAAIRASYDLHLFTRDMRSQHCDNCASSFHEHFALGCRMYSERVWLCSVECYRQLRAKWYPTQEKPNRTFWQFISHLFHSER
jgi:hypothetical protein